MSRRALVVGAGSGIGRALCRALAAEGYDLLLAGRRPEELALDATDLHLRHGVQADPIAFDAFAPEGLAAFWDRCLAHAPGGFHGVALCFGAMPEQAEAASDPAVLARMTTVNSVAPAVLLGLAGRDRRARGGGGWLVAVTSVAGVRGRASNYLYGATKAALSTCLSGLRAELSRDGVAVIDVRPGVIDTGLTWGLSLPLPGRPEQVARDTLRAIRRNRPVVYTPWRWWPIMTAIRCLPDVVFRRLRF